MKKTMKTIKKHHNENLENIKERYELCETEVINCHPYENVTNIRFKYTERYTCKRRRINLVVNKLKDEESVVSATKYTRWATHRDIEYGDLIISFIGFNELLEVKKQIIINCINKELNIIEEHQKKLKFYRDLL